MSGVGSGWESGVSVRPEDVPKLRELLVGDWSEGGVLAEIAPILNVSGDVNEYFADEERFWAEKADLWFVGEEMCALLEHARTELPPTTLTSGLVTHDGSYRSAGLVVFADPIFGMSAKPDEPPIPVGAMTWHPAEYSGWNAGRGRMGLSILLYFVEPGEKRLLPLGRVSWLEGEDTDALLGGLSELQEASMAEDRRTLAAMLLLASQPGVAEVGEKLPPRQQRREAERKGRKLSPVRVIRLRAAVERERSGRGDGSGSGDGDGEGGRKREYHQRWVVTGHWRQQAYGKGWTLRRPRWIAPYVKGPKEAPMDTRPTVKAWVK